MLVRVGEPGGVLNSEWQVPPPPPPPPPPVFEGRKMSVQCTEVEETRNCAFIFNDIAMQIPLLLLSFLC